MQLKLNLNMYVLLCMMKCVHCAVGDRQIRWRGDNGMASTASAGLNTSSEGVKLLEHGGDGTDHGDSGVAPA